ncbi:MAG: hypothetical protein ACE5OS_10360 [Anaerolineae bacterium]
MFEQTIETSATPHITVTECLGDLVVRGSKEPQVVLRLRDGAEDVILEQEGKVFTIEARTDCALNCPSGSTLTVHTVRGDLKVKGVQGPVAVKAVYGDVILRTVGPTALEQSYGDLSARQVAGDLQVQSLAGDARIREVDGVLSIGQVGSDLKAEGVQGGLAAERVGADVVLGPPFSSGATYRLNAGSDLRLRIPAGASLRLTLRAGGRIRSRIPGLSLEKVDGETKGVLGAGEASLEAQVGGRVYLRYLGPERTPAEEPGFDFVADMEGLGAQIEASIAEAMAEMEARLEESLSRIDSEDIRRKVERATEQALRKTEWAAGRARRVADREVERARLRAERAERRWQRASGRRSRPKREPATDEERMRILRMVEEGKVTPEQAADLLAALEGR